MTILSSIKLSLRGLRANKKRSFMTMLGIIIGVGSVIVIMSVGAGAQSLIVNEIASSGSNIFAVLPGASNEDGPPASAMGIVVTTLKLDEIEDIRKIPHVTYVTAFVKGIDTAIFGNQSITANFTGTTNEIIHVEDLDLGEGRFFTADEAKSISKVAVLGSQIKEDLFGDGDAIGETIKLKKHNFKVIGVFNKMGTKAFENKDNQIYIPIVTAQKLLLGINHVSYIRGRADDSSNLPLIVEEVRKTIRDNHNIDNPEDDDFSVRSMDQALSILGDITDALKLFLTSIAAISLLVGGVGIMNIMLVNITERTREIGLRKSVGATKAHILKQFLIESATMTLIGGMIGITIGILISALIALGAQAAGYKWDFIITTPSIFLGLGVSAAVGLIFGSYPAIKAGSLEPVEALRVE